LIEPEFLLGEAIRAVSEVRLMSTIATTFPAALPSLSTPPPRALYRLSIDKYEAKVRSGVFTNRDRLELIEGFLVAKMAQHLPHTVSSELCRVKLDRMLPPGWHLRIERPLRIPSRSSKPEPDLVVFWGEIRDFAPRDPEPTDIALVIEVADSSLDDDRNLMSRVYGGAGVDFYWIVNLVERQVEAYSSPSGPSEPIGYRHCDVYRPGQDVPFGVAGSEVGRIPVDAFWP
jgi:Uma2 family endonuclease